MAEPGVLQSIRAKARSGCVATRRGKANEPSPLGVPMVSCVFLILINGFATPPMVKSFLVVFGKLLLNSSLTSPASKTTVYVAPGT